MIGQNDQLSHTLVPLAMAVTLVRSRLSPRLDGAAGLAGFIASTVRVFEYFEDPNWLPRRLAAPLHDGVLREDGGELLFIDGRPPKRLLAVRADDVECVIGMLNDPERASCIRAAALSAASARIRRNSKSTRAKAAELRACARAAREGDAG